MKQVSAPGFVVLALVLMCNPAVSAESTIETMTLQPGEVKEFSIDAQVKTKVGFRPDSAQSMDCKNNCVEISQKGGVTMASKFGATIGMKPMDGKIEGTLKNLEAFPIGVELFRK